MKNPETVTIYDQLGPLHLAVILGALALLVVVAVAGILKRIKGNSVSGHWRLAFMLGIAVYFWGQMWIDVRTSKMQFMMASPNTGFDPSIPARALAEIHGIGMIYSGLSFSYVVLAICIAIIGGFGKGKQIAERQHRIPEPPRSCDSL